MNIFFLDRSPTKAAEYHIDKHVIKMIQESAQMLSTAHRCLDGVMTSAVLSPMLYRNVCTLGWTGRNDCKQALLPGEALEFVIHPELKGWTIVNKAAMRMTHRNHPCNAWIRQSVQHYNWLYQLFKALSEEKKHRYPKGPNESWKLYGEFLSHPPKNLADNGFVDPPLAMPARYKIGDAVASYRNFYVGDKYYFANWTNRSIPSWFLKGIPEAWKENADDRIALLSDPAKAKKTVINLKHVKKYLPNVF